MKKYAKWAFDNMLIVALMIAAAAGTAGMYQARETDATGYRFFVQEWEEANEATRLAIRAALDDGKVSRWESAGIVQMLMEEKRVLVFTTAEPENVEREREKLIRQVGP